MNLPSAVPSYYADIPVAKRDTYYAQAEQELNKRRVLGEAAFKQQVDNSLSEYAANGTSTRAPTEQEFMAALGPNRGAVAAGEFRANATAAAAGYQVQRMPLHEGLQYVETLKPETGDAFFAEKYKGYVAAKETAGKIQTQMNSDFSQHVTNINPEARAALETAISSQDPGEGKDAVNKYVNLISSEAARIGVKAPDLLPKAVTGAISSMLEQKVSTPEAAASVVNSIAAMKERWGSSWPRVYGELKQSLSPLAQVLSSNIPPQAAVLLASVHDKSFEDLAKVITKAEKINLTAELSSNFAELAKTEWGGQGDTPAFFGQAQKLGALYAQQGMNGSQAADKAYKELVSSRYVFDGGLRIPIEQASVIKNIQAAQLEALKTVDMSTHSRGVSKEDAISWYSTSTEWRTLPDNSGVILMEGGNVVRSEDGKAIQRSWRALADVKPLNPDEAFLNLVKQQGVY